MNFKVGDQVKLLPHWNGGLPLTTVFERVYTVVEITENFDYKGTPVTKIELSYPNSKSLGMWAEPHEIVPVSKLDKVLK